MPKPIDHVKPAAGRVTVTKAITQAEKDEAATNLWIGMAQFAAKIGAALPAEDAREIIDAEVRLVRVPVGRRLNKRFITQKVAIADGNRYRLPGQVHHVPKEGVTYTGVKFMHTRINEEVFVPFSGAGKAVFDAYNKVHPGEELLGDNTNPTWCVVNGAIRVLVNVTEGKIFKDGMRQAGVVVGTSKQLTLEEDSKGPPDGIGIFEVVREGPKGINGTYVAPFEKEKGLYPASSRKVISVQAAKVPEIPISDELFGCMLATIDPSSIIAFGRRWIAQPWADHPYRAAAKSVGVKVPDGETEGKAHAGLWLANRGQAELASFLRELETEIWATLPEPHTHNEAMEILGISEIKDVDAQQAIDVAKKLRAVAFGIENDPVFAWMVAEGVAWANAKSPIAIAARKRTITRCLGVLNRPTAMIQISVQKRKVPINAWGLLRPQGRDDEAIQKALVEGRAEADGTAANERLEFVNNEIKKADLPELDLTKPGDKARFIACLEKAAIEIKAALAPPAPTTQPPAPTTDTKTAESNATSQAATPASETTTTSEGVPAQNESQAP